MSGRHAVPDGRKNNRRNVPATGSSTEFSLIPLLLTGQSISSEARQAIRENRLQDAAVILMKQYGLNCDEAGDLLNVTAC